MLMSEGKVNVVRTASLVSATTRMVERLPSHFFCERARLPGDCEWRVHGSEDTAVIDASSVDGLAVPGSFNLVDVALAHMDDKVLEVEVGSGAGG